MRVLAALSGGVDSAVAAARAIAAGHDVTGIHLALQLNPIEAQEGSRGCCSIDDTRDARRAADVLGIPFYVLGMAEEFQRDVLADFLAEYERGRTPNPCLRCNEKIKFAALLDKGIGMGFDAVCTGHYAQLEVGADSLVQLHRAVDVQKDQSYVLGVLEQWQLEKSIFPLGDTTKPAIREEAASLGLLVANKPDSHDICFIPDGDTAGFISQKIKVSSGEIRDVETGESLGQHRGAQLYTIGQRQGLGIGTPAVDGRPRFVVRTDVVDNIVYVGSEKHLLVDQLVGESITWTRAPLTVGDRVGMQWRAHGREVGAEILSLSSDEILIALDEEVRAVAPGQQAVLYQGSEVRGSFVIGQAGKR